MHVWGRARLSSVYIPIFMTNNFPFLDIQFDKGYHVYVFPQELVVLFVINYHLYLVHMNTSFNIKYILKENEMNFNRVKNRIMNLSLSWWSPIFFHTVFHNFWFTKDLEVQGEENVKIKIIKINSKKISRNRVVNPTRKLISHHFFDYKWWNKYGTRGISPSTIWNLPFFDYQKKYRFFKLYPSKILKH